MSKPFVVMLPAAERESLRNAGVIPAGFFRSFELDSDDWDDRAKPDSEVYLWPYDLKYAESERLVADIERNPADIAAFFGIDAVTDEAERRQHERLVARLLGAVCVHVVFLDRKRAGTGYAAFGSFSEIAQWSRNFRKALDIRFANTPAFQNTENVLVIVARGQQVKATEGELAEFAKCVGTAPDCSFRSCYYMDYNLRVGTTGRVVHAADVWDVMVSRLLLGFVLSREEVPEAANSQRTFWQRPGIKLWRAQECHVGIDTAAQNAFLNDALSMASSLVGNWTENREVDNLALLSPSDGDVVSLEGLEHLAQDEHEPDWRSADVRSWCDFSGRRCAEGTRDEDGRRWRSRFDGIRRAYSAWMCAHRPGEKLPDSKAVFSGVKTKPGLVFKGTERLLAVLHENRDRIAGLLTGGDNSAESSWQAVAEAELKRRRQLDRVTQDAVEYDSARRHYAGWLPGLIVFMSVSVLFGWVLHRLVVGLGGKFATSLTLAGASTVGALVAVVLVLCLHGRAGRRALTALTKESVEADKLMVFRDNRVRQMAANALEVRRQLALRAQRFRVWALLERVKSILQTEIQTKNASITVYDAMDADWESDVGDQSSVGRRFRCATDVQLGLYAPDHGPVTQTDVMQRVESWWSVRQNQEEGSRAENFLDLWTRLCARDRECAGYYPARLFAHEIRSFVARFTDDLRHMEEELVIRDNFGEVKQGLEDWYRSVVNSDSYLWATGSVTGLHVNERKQAAPSVYLEPDAKLADLHALGEISRTHSSSLGQFVPVHSNLVGLLPQLAFMFQEYTVEFGSDASGNLVFKEVSDAV